MAYCEPQDKPKVKRICDKEHVARKVRLCSCGRPILPGERYTRHVYIVDGTFDVTIEGHHGCGTPDEEIQEMGLDDDGELPY
jgi:hypothetical protein